VPADQFTHLRPELSLTRGGSMGMCSYSDRVAYAHLSANQRPVKRVLVTGAKRRREALHSFSCWPHVLAPSPYATQPT